MVTLGAEIEGRKIYIILLETSFGLCFSVFFSTQLNELTSWLN